MEIKPREGLKTRIGFLLVSAGSAVGLGNVWRFPFITGQYGGAAFVVVYLLFLVLLGLPVMMMEFSIGRAGRGNIVTSMMTLQKPGQKWHWAGYLGVFGVFLSMCYYTSVGSWIISYIIRTLSGSMAGLGTDGLWGVFGEVTAGVAEPVGFMILTIIIAFFIISRGVQKGLERASTWMMGALYVIMFVLIIRAVTLPGAGAGISFFLAPDFSKLSGEGIAAAMGQSFLTLSLGMGAMSIFGSYIKKDRSLLGESATVIGLDSAVALMAGLIIFPACAAFSIEPTSGPGLVFVTLPSIFNQIAGGAFFGVLFFILLFFAALTSIIAAFEALVGFMMEQWKFTRKKASLVIGPIALILGGLPAVLGYGVLAGVQPLGPGTSILDLEDKIFSGYILPLGALLITLFCSVRYGWGWDKFVEESNAGKGMKVPKFFKPLFKYVTPAIIIAVFIFGIIG